MFVMIMHVLHNTPDTNLFLTIKTPKKSLSRINALPTTNKRSHQLPGEANSQKTPKTSLKFIPKPSKLSQIPPIQIKCLAQLPPRPYPRPCCCGAVTAPGLFSFIAKNPPASRTWSPDSILFPISTETLGVSQIAVRGQGGMVWARGDCRRRRRAGGVWRRWAVTGSERRATRGGQSC